MFGRKRAETATVATVAVAPPPVITLPLLKPTAKMLDANHSSIDAWEEVANRIGFEPAKALEEKLLIFFTKNRMPIYDNTEVHRYLKSKASKLGSDYVWIWRPLRRRDAELKLNLEGFGDRKSGGRRNGSMSANYAPYHQIVPLKMLEQVETIQKISSKLGFYISDYKEEKPDPFIMVTGAGVQRFIFGMWDEPDFGL